MARGIRFGHAGNPKFQLGTRVLKYFDGYPNPFHGIVDHYTPDSGFYHIRYDDGDSEEMTEDDVQEYFFQSMSNKKPLDETRRTTSPRGMKRSSPRNASLRINSPSSRGATIPPSASIVQVDVAKPSHVLTPAEISRIVGQRVCKVVEQDGQKAVVGGTVSSYFPANNMYRVLYFDGSCEDLSYDDVQRSIELFGHDGAAESRKRKLPAKHQQETSSDTPSHALKKSKASQQTSEDGQMDNPAQEKTMAHAADSSEPTDKYDTASKSPNDNTDVKFTDNDCHKNDDKDSDTVTLDEALCYSIMRNTLFLITSTKANTHEAKEKQLRILSNDAEKPKRSLELFIEYDGLSSLRQLLTRWSQSAETEKGVLLILKILYVMPGITADAVVRSSIGKKIQEIKKLARRREGTDPQVTDLAASLVAKWRKELTPKSTKAKREEKVPDVKESTEDATPRNRAPEVKEKALDSNGSNRSTPVNIRPSSNSANYLKRLMAPSKARDILGNALGAKSPRPLGPAYARKPKRSTVLIDTLTDRKVREDAAHAEAEKQRIQEEAVQKEEASRVTRIKFGDSEAIMFSINSEVSRLFKDQARYGGPIVKQSTPQSSSNSSSALKSILKRQSLGKTEHARDASEGTSTNVAIGRNPQQFIASAGDKKNAKESSDTALPSRSTEVSAHGTKDIPANQVQVLSSAKIAHVDGPVPMKKHSNQDKASSTDETSGSEKDTEATRRVPLDAAALHHRQENDPQCEGGAGPSTATPMDFERPNAQQIDTSTTKAPDFPSEASGPMLSEAIAEAPSAFCSESKDRTVDPERPESESAAVAVASVSSA